MFDDYLKTQNRIFMIFNIIISTSATTLAAFLILEGHMLLAFLEFCIAIAVCSGLIGLAHRNKDFMKKWNAMNSVEYGSYDLDDAEDMSNRGIGNLSFDFKKPSE
jgi:hypothetical protein